MKIINQQIALVALGTLLCGGCLKDKSYDDGKIGFTPDNNLKIVEIAGPANGTYGTVLEFSNTDTSFGLVTVRVAADQPVSQDVTVKLVEDATLITQYNTDNQTNYTVPAAAKYNFPTLTVTIPRGQREASLPFTFKDPSYLQTGRYALGLRIQSVETAGYLKSGNFDNQIIFLRVRNAYDGTYNQTGIMSLFNGPVASEATLAGEYDIEGATAFSTYEPNSVEGQLVIAGFTEVRMILVINADNSVTIGPSDIIPFNAMRNIPGKASSYDPATHTFDIHGEYLNGAGNLRQFDFTMELE